MLSLMRGFAKSKIAVGILFLTMFGFLGLGGSRYFGGGGQNFTDGAFVHAGDIKAGRPEFDMALDNAAQQLSQQYRREIKREVLAAEPNYVAGIVSQLTSRAALVAYGEDQGFKLDRSPVVRLFAQTPTFKNGLGQVDETKIAEFAREKNFPNSDLFKEYVRLEIAEQYLRVGAVGGLKPPAILTKPVADYFTEQRTIAVAEFSQESIPKPAPPTEQQLRDFYKANLADYSAPELRGFTVVQYSPMDYIGKVKVTDEQIKADYDKRIKEFSSPETRELSTVKGADRATIQKVVDLVKQGKPLLDSVAAVPGATLDTRSVQPGFTKDENLNKAAFGWAQGDIQGPFQADGAWNAYLVKSITKGTPLPLNEALKSQIRDDVAYPEARKTYEALSETITDNLGAGIGIEELAQTVSAPVISIEPMDVRGRSVDGQASSLLGPYLDRKPLYATTPTLTAAFQLQQGGLPIMVDADHCPSPWAPNRPGATCNSRLIIRLDSIVPPHARPFEDVRPVVESAWTRGKQIEAIKKVADDVVAKVKAGETLEAAAKAAKLKYQVVPRPIDRISQGPDQSTVESILKLNKGDVVALSLGQQQGNPLPTIVQVTEASKIDPAAHPEIAGLAERSIRETLQGDLVQVLLNGATLKVKPTVNQAAVDAYAKTVAGAPPEAPQ